MSNTHTHGAGCCPRCTGGGHVTSHEVCPECAGQGCWNTDGHTMTCEACHGTGHKNVPCPECNGGH